MLCKYCLEQFNIEYKKPFRLPCNHILCYECILQLSEVTRNCPFDKKFIDFLSAVEDEDSILDLKHLCKIHSLKIKALCKSHSQLLCDECIQTHSQCRIIEGTIKNIIKIVDQIIEASLLYEEKVCNSKIFTNENCFNSFEHLVEEVEKSKIEPYTGKNIQSIVNVVKDRLELKQDTNKEEFNFDIFQKFLLHKNYYADELTLKETDIITSETPGVLLYFIQTEINKNDFNSYICYFEHEFAEFLTYTGCYIGCPSVEGQLIYLTSLEIRVNEYVYRHEPMIIEHQKNRLTYCLFFNEEIYAKKNDLVYVFIELEGSSNYIFKQINPSMVTVKNAFMGVYQETHPILALTIKDIIN